jgi:hypothetical protein
MGIAEVVGIVSTSLGIIAMLGKYLVVVPLKNLIREQTYPIQPNANGGKSLPDVARNVIEVKACVEALTHQIDRVEGRLDTHIEQHVRGEA